MINHIMVTGDCHAGFSRFKTYSEEFCNDESCAVIILGDSGLNYTLDEGDSQLKNILSKRYKFTIYCVRGNHEARPQDVPGMELIYDEDVCGEVWYQARWPKIRYFKDWGLYNICGHSVAVIGGAYSVDKFYRLKNNLRWFKNEQLSKEERDQCIKDLSGADVDFILAHTCPYPWRPQDMFLSQVDQSTVDNTMELFLTDVCSCLKWRVFLFGHYHDDRLVLPFVEMYYKDSELLEDIWERWARYEEDKSLDWWLNKGPTFYQEDKLVRDREVIE